MRNTLVDRSGLLALLAVLTAATASGQRPPIERQSPAAVTDAAAARMVRVRGVDLAYVEQGRGEPVVLLHGFLHDYRVWTAELAGLSGNHRVIAYSRRHRWPNRPPAGGAEVSPAADLQDLAAFIGALKIERAHLVGHSAGANLALAYARAHPDRVRSLVLAEPGLPSLLSGRSDVAPPFTPALVAEMRSAYEKGDRDRALQLLVGAVLGAGGAARPLPARAAQIARDNAWQLEQIWSGGEPETPFTCDDARRIAVPVLLVGGQHSPAFFRASLDELQKCLPGSERATIPDASHGLQLENPQAFDRIVSAFLLSTRIRR